MEDRAWETVQMKAFQHWANGYLPKEYAISNLQNDFADGLRTIHLAEALTNSTITKYQVRPKGRMHYIENNHLALRHLKLHSKAKLDSYGPEDFTDGNLKAILGCLWVLLQNFRVRLVEDQDKSFEESMLTWLRETLSEYQLEIENFSSSCSDGRVFLALMHKYDNASVDYEAIGDDSYENVEKAFCIAEKNIDIPRLVESNKVSSGTCDERSIVLYITLIQQAFVRKFAIQEATAELDGIGIQLEQARHQIGVLMQKKLELEEINSRCITNVGDHHLKGVGDERDDEVWNNSYQRLSSSYMEEQRRNQYLEEKVNVMERMMAQHCEEKAHADMVSDTLNNELMILKRILGDLEMDCTEIKQERDLLRDEQRSLMDNIEELKEMVSRIEGIRKKENEMAQNGLKVLGKNLVEHLRDMKVWKSYLNQERWYASEVVQMQTGTLLDGMSMQAQLGYLSNSLQSENVQLESLLEAMKKLEVSN